MEFTRSYRIPKLADIGRCDLCNDLSSFTKCMSQLENLGLVRNSSKRTAYHAHTAGNTFLIINLCTAKFITSNCLYTTSSFTRTFFMRNSIIWTDRFAFSAFHTFCLINMRFAVYHRDCTLWTSLHTWMSHTSSAHIAYLIHIRRTGRTGRWDNLHKRRFIIFLINIGSFHSISQMNCFILWTKRKTHGQSYTLTGNCTFTVDTLTVLGPFLYDIIRDRFNIMDQSIIGRFKTKFCHFGEDLSANLFYWGIKSSHILLLSPINLFPRSFNDKNISKKEENVMFFI